MAQMNIFAEILLILIFIRKKHFLGEEQVSSKAFNQILCQYFHIAYEQSILQFKCLDALLTVPKKKGIIDYLL